MQTRRDFLKLAAIASGAAGISGLVPESIQRAYAIEPTPGSTYLDAEHIVILMQENRSSEHYFGILHGVRDRVCFSLPEEAFWNSLFSATPVCAWSITASA